MHLTYVYMLSRLFHVAVQVTYHEAVVSIPLYLSIPVYICLYSSLL